MKLLHNIHIYINEKGVAMKHINYILKTIMAGATAASIMFTPMVSYAENSFTMTKTF